MKWTYKAWMAAACALGLAGAAQARSDVAWSVGVAVPGMVIGATNAPPVYYAPQPVYVQPQPVYVAPRPVYVGAPYYVAPYHGRKWKKNKHWRHEARKHGWHDARGYYR
jgi:hypothetical protein